MSPRQSLVTLLVAAIPFGVSGCEQPKHINHFDVDGPRPLWVPKYASWPELDALTQTLEISLPKYLVDPQIPSLQMQKELDSPDFQKLVRQFSETPVPAQFSTPERAQAKQDLLNALQSVQKSVKADDRKSAGVHIQKFNEAYQKIHTIPQADPPPTPAAMPPTSDVAWSGIGLIIGWCLLVGAVAAWLMSRGRRPKGEPNPVDSGQ